MRKIWLKIALVSALCLALMLAMTACKCKHKKTENAVENEIAPTCTADGSYDEVVYCSVTGCGAEISREAKTITAPGHTPGAPVIENNEAANCFTGGTYEEVVYCTVSGCGAEISRTPKTVPATGEHIPAAAVIENEVAATCTVDGSFDEVAYCSVAGCGAEISRTPKAIPAPGHSYTVEDTTGAYLATPQDCENAATHYYSCACGDKGTETFTVGEPRGHSYVVENTDLAYRHTAATEYSPAIYYKSCICGKASETETFTSGDMLPGYLTYHLSSDSSYYIVTGYVGGQETVSVPHIHNALPVFGIASGAFRNNPSLKAISMPNSIRLIGDYAFAGCTALESVIIPTSVSSISERTFSGCTSLGTITLHAGIETLGAFAFENCTALTSIMLNAGLKTISDGAFDHCTALESITIPDTVEVLGNTAFRHAESLRSVRFSKALTSIGNAAFQNCVSLESVELHENITRLGNSAFSDCRALRSLRILGNISEIGFSTFYECRGLESIYFASETGGDLGNTNYIFYNAGIEGDGITLTVANGAVLPTGLLTPYVNENIPKVTSIVIEDGTERTDCLTSQGRLPYLTSVSIPISMVEMDSKALYGYAGLTVNMIWDNENYFIEWYDTASFDSEPVDVTAYEGSSSLLYPKWVTYTLSLEAGLDTAGSVLGEGVYIENKLVTVTASTNPGYHFVGWFDGGALVSTSEIYAFNINKPTALLATWEANTDTPYKVEYYLENVDKNGYELVDTDEFIGTTDAAVTAEIKSFAHFTYNEGASSVIENIDGRGNLVLKVYYTRNIYTVSGVNGSVIGGGSIPYGATITVSPIAYPGYEFDGWYSGNTLLSDSTTYTLTVEKSVEAKFAPKAEMANFTFTSTATSCTITGVKDKSVTEIALPGYVTSIGDYAFYGCTKLTSVTIPDDITSIGYDSFSDCTGLEEIYFNAVAMNDLSSNNYVFCDAGKNGDGIKVIIGKDVTRIPAYLFCPYSDSSYYSPKIVSVEFEDGSVCESIGNYAFYNCTGLTSVTIGRGVTTIGDYAFHNCTGLTSVIIPNSVTSIGNYAFSGCTGLEAVYITDIAAWCGISFGSSYANPLYYANNLYLIEDGEAKLITDLVIPESITNIKDYAFYNCTSLTSVTIPNSVTSIGSDAFYWCTGLEAVYITDIAAWCGISFGNIYANPLYYANNLYFIEREEARPLSGDLVIPDGVKSIGHCAFYGCTGLTSVVIPDSVTSIGNYAFYGCTGLTSVTIPNSVTSIGQGALSGCSSLEGLTIPFVGDSRKTSSDTYQYPLGYIFGTSSYTGGVATTQYYYGSSTSSTTYDTYYIPASLKSVTVTGGNILRGAFYRCTGLTSVTIGSGVTSIGDYAFYNCDGLTSMTIPNSVTSIGNSAFYDCDGLTSMTIPNSVTSIGNYAFYDCGGLTSVTIGSGVTSIGSSAFNGCTGLTSVTIPNSVTSIGDYAFSCCTGLKRVTIGSGVTSIGNYAFEDCTGLTSVTIGSGVTSIGNYAFRRCTGLTSVTIPNSVTSIGNYAFDGCRNLVEVINKSSEITITKGSTSNGYVGYYAIEVHNGESKIVDKDGYLFITSGRVNYLLGYKGEDKELVLPESYNGERYEIYKDAFYKRDDITSVAIPNSVTSIGNSAFADCTGLTSVTIGSGVTSIGEYAFYYCTGLTSVTIGDSVTSIGYGAFHHCTGLTSVTIGDSVTSIGNSAFHHCTGLTSVTIGRGVTSIGELAFYDCYKLVEVINKSSLTITKGYSSNGYVGRYALEVHKGESKIVDKDGYLFITSGRVNYLLGYIGEDKDLVLPESYNGQNYVIHDYAFYNRDDITSVTIPNSITSIGYSAFEYCDGLTSVTIGSGVTIISYYAFYGCDSLTRVTFANPYGWRVSDGSSISASNLANTSTAATYLTSTYRYYYWDKA